VFTLYPKTTAEASAGMVAIAAGELMMGSSDLVQNGDPANAMVPPEYPRHAVNVETCYLDPTEVTNRAFEAFLTTTRRDDWRNEVWPETGRPDPDRLDWPVTNIRYEQAVEYAAWRGCRLPEEKELEWAARGPQGRKAPPAGPQGAPRDPLEWMKLHPVQSDPIDRIDTPAGPLFGLYGNAGELTLLRYRPYPTRLGYRHYSSHWMGYVVRSGMMLDSQTLQPTFLGYIRRGTQLPEMSNPLVGFRCARSLRPRVGPVPLKLTHAGAHS
jgi:formylglycine-generating enzyme required for sulfatase activity